MENPSDVELGFLEKVPLWKLHHRYFPSKIGGFPAWLDLQNLPLPQVLQCPSCGEPTSFLMQMYAEEDASDPSGGSFHRTIFVFACRRSSCIKPGLSKSVIILRCGLPRKNDFYGQEPAIEDPDAKDPEVKNPLCSVCGCLAPNTCSSCKKTFYCSRSHQILAWKSGHKEECVKIKGDPEVLRGEPIKSKVVFAEYELISEPEDPSDGVKLKSEEERNEEYKDTVSKLKPELNGVEASELEKYCGNSKDKVFRQFQKRIDDYPNQVLRYDRGGQPLLISGKNVPGPNLIPKCKCGARRKFEFQIMPQILNYLEQEETLEDGLDFGTILIYTCPKNCHGNLKYVPEIAWVQFVDEGKEINGDRDFDENDNDSDSD